MSDTTAGAAAPKPDERLAYRGVFQRALIRPEIGAAIGAIFIWVFFWAVSVKFGEASGASSILDVAASPLGIVAVAGALLMIGGEFDLSSGAATGALGILTILLVRDVNGLLAGAGFSLWMALPISLAAALGLGWWNGFLVNRTSLPSFIVTLGSFFVLKGAKLGFSKLIVDQIQVGKLDDLQIYADESAEYKTALAQFQEQFGAERVEELRASGGLAEALGLEGSFTESIIATGGNTSDKGYGLLDTIFAGEWVRNEHIWESRDWFYSIGMIAGLCIAVLAVYELHFRRRDSFNPAGLGVFAAGAVVGIIGINRLHATDSTGGNTTGAVLIAGGMLVATIGWCMWRYAMRPEGAGNLSLAGSGAMTPLVGGIVAFVASIVTALWFDAQNGEDLSDAFDLGGGTMLLIAIVVAVIAAAISLRGEIVTGFSAVDLFLGETRAKVISAVIVAMLGTIGFLNLSTEQGARAIIFLALAIGAVVALMIAANRGRRHSDALGSALLFLVSVGVVVMAFFIRSESTAPKFRAQAFTIMLLIAAVMAIWALATARFEVRRFPDVAADGFGRNLGLFAVALITVGLVSRLMWVTQAELDAGLTQTKFSVRILWFLGFTAVVSWVLARTRFGSWTFAVGGNKEAARQVGVPAARTKTQLFMVVSFAAWLVGLLLAFRLNTIQASTGDGEEFEYIIAAVVGGTALTGGYGSTLGAGIGALIMAMAIQGIPSARWNSDWRFVFVGGILLLAVVANNYIRTKAEAAR